MKQIQNSDYIGYADCLHIIFNDKHIEKFLDSEHCIDSVKFEDILNVAISNGYEEGAIILIAESPLNGVVYQYGNYGDYWVEHGETKGYA